MTGSWTRVPVKTGFAIRAGASASSAGSHTTYERIERTTIKVIKKDGSRVPFDRKAQGRAGKSLLENGPSATAA